MHEDTEVASATSDIGTADLYTRLVQTLDLKRFCQTDAFAEKLLATAMAKLGLRRSHFTFEPSFTRHRYIAVRLRRSCRVNPSTTPVSLEILKRKATPSVQLRSAPHPQ